MNIQERLNDLRLIVGGNGRLLDEVASASGLVDKSKLRSIMKAESGLNPVEFTRASSTSGDYIGFVTDNIAVGIVTWASQVSFVVLDKPKGRKRYATGFDIYYLVDTAERMIVRKGVEDEQRCWGDVLFGSNIIKSVDWKRVVKADTAARGALVIKNDLVAMLEKTLKSGPCRRRAGDMDQREIGGIIDSVVKVQKTFAKGFLWPGGVTGKTVDVVLSDGWKLFSTPHKFRLRGPGDDYYSYAELSSAVVRRRVNRILSKVGDDVLRRMKYREVEKLIQDQARTRLQWGTYDMWR